MYAKPLLYCRLQPQLHDSLAVDQLQAILEVEFENVNTKGLLHTVLVEFF